MATSSRPDRAPRLVFAVGSLAEGQGGIAELSRQVFRVLGGMHREGLLEVQVRVLDDSGPAEGDDLFLEDPPPARWYAGQRTRFAAGLLVARADGLLFDHVGLARLQGGLPRRLVPPYAVLIHSVEIWRSRRRDYHRTARHARLLVANSHYTARRAREHCPGLPEIVVCWPGKDRSEPGLTAEVGALPELGPHAMLIVGRLDPTQRHKGHDQLLEAMPSVAHEVPDAQLVVAGGGHDLGRLVEKARNLGIGERVLFLGRVSRAQLQELYRRCCLFAMPSDGDGFGLVFLEAMMHGLPCVGLAGSAAAEIFEGGRSGLLTDREDRSVLAGNLTNLLRDAELRVGLGSRGLERYSSSFTQAHFAARLQKLIMQWVCGHSGSTTSPVSNPR